MSVDHQSHEEEKFQPEDYKMQEEVDDSEKPVEKVKSSVEKEKVKSSGEKEKAKSRRKRSISIHQQEPANVDSNNNNAGDQTEPTKYALRRSNKKVEDKLKQLADNSARQST